MESIVRSGLRWGVQARGTVSAGARGIKVKSGGIRRENAGNGTIATRKMTRR
jgi:hypothetical protein